MLDAILVELDVSFTGLSLDAGPLAAEADFVATSTEFDPLGESLRFYLNSRNQFSGILSETVRIPVASLVSISTTFPNRRLCESERYSVHN